MNGRATTISCAASFKPIRLMPHWGIIIAALMLAGCSSIQKSEQLARIAKDWSLVVRASQVIPVYPLTEDVQPGDLFLVRTPIEKQVEVYESKGFLPLDQLLVRLQPSTYGTFYNKAYEVGLRTDTPHHWQFPPEGASGWSNAPRAAFPSYNFTVD
jgi:hypothetical protein